MCRSMVVYYSLWQSAIGVIAYEPMDNIADYSRLQQTTADYSRLLQYIIFYLSEFFVFQNFLSDNEKKVIYCINMEIIHVSK